MMKREKRRINKKIGRVRAHYKRIRHEIQIGMMEKITGKRQNKPWWVFLRWDIDLDDREQYKIERERNFITSIEREWKTIEHVRVDVLKDPYLMPYRQCVNTVLQKIKQFIRENGDALQPYDKYSIIKSTKEGNKRRYLIEMRLGGTWMKFVIYSMKRNTELLTMNNNNTKNNNNNNERVGMDETIGKHSQNLQQQDKNNSTSQDLETHWEQHQRARRRRRRKPMHNTIK